MSFRKYIEEEPSRAYIAYKIFIIVLLFLFVIIASLVLHLVFKPLIIKIPAVAIVLIVSYFSYRLSMVDPKTKIKKIFQFLYNSDLDLYEVQWISRDFEKFLGADFEILNEIYNDYYSLRNRLSSEYAPDLSDYSCMVLPLAKAYEGVLKKILVRAGFISEADLQENPDISIGKYFNPVGNNAIFRALKDQARDKAIPHVIYSTYQECRNLIFHYDPYRDNRLKTIEDAEFYERRISDAIKKAFETFQKVEAEPEVKTVKVKMTREKKSKPIKTKISLRENETTG